MLIDRINRELMAHSAQGASGAFAIIAGVQACNQIEIEARAAKCGTFSRSTPASLQYPQAYEAIGKSLVDSWYGDVLGVPLLLDPDAPYDFWKILHFDPMELFRGVDRDETPPLLSEAKIGEFTVKRTAENYRKPANNTIDGLDGYDMTAHYDLSVTGTRPVETLDEQIAEMARRIAAVGGKPNYFCLGCRKMTDEPCGCGLYAAPIVDPEHERLKLRKEIYDQAIAECSAQFDKTYGATIESQANEIVRLKNEIAQLRRPRDPSVTIDPECVG